MIKRLTNAFEFFKTTVSINVAVSLVPLLFGGVDFFIPSLISYGFVMSLVFKEVYRKSDYLFYFNNGLSKLRLWLICYALTFIFAVLTKLFFNLITYLF